MNKKIFTLSVLVFVIDQIVKGILSAVLILNKDYIIIKNFFAITLVNNTGGAWSILSNMSVVLIIGTIIALVIIYKYMYSFVMNKRNTIAFGLLTGGILGNLANRILQGYVVDFLNFNFFGYDFPVFNIADICIVIGILLLIYAIIKGEDKIANKSKK